MKNPLQQSRSYKFHFWKDKFWIWALVLPCGLICWAIPFVLLFGLGKISNSPDWFPYFGFLFLGIPAYLIGWIFVYSLMEGIYTKVTLTDDKISIRLPWLIFPILPVTKRIDVTKINRVNLFARYGSRIAVFLYYKNRRGKERHFYLPMFQYDPAYRQEMQALQAKVEGTGRQPSSVAGVSVNESLEKNQRLQAAMSAKHLPPSPVERIIRGSYFLVLVAIFAVSAWISSSIPPGGIVSIEIGFSIAFVLALIGLVGFFPMIGQILIWFFGRAVITWTANFIAHLSTDQVIWSTPDSINDLLARFNLDPVHATYTDFLFWSVLLYSSLISLDCLIGWFRRRNARSFD